MIVKKEAYVYKNCPIPGGGYVTSFLFGENDPDAFYIRTDVGGSYRFDRPNERWLPLNDDVTMADTRETCPIAIATDESRKGSLFIISGLWGDAGAKLAVSDDYGGHFVYYNLPFRSHGNLSGRGTGNKLIVSRNNSDMLIYASQMDGLWKSMNRGKDWVKYSTLPEDFLTFVCESPDGKIMLAGSAGVSTAQPSGQTALMANKKTEEIVNRGATLYASYDGGESFVPLEVPCIGDMSGIKMPGSVPERVAVTTDAFYVTTCVMSKKCFFPPLAYSCDSGHVSYGRVLKYPIVNGRIGEVRDITPPREECGFAGIAVLPDRKHIYVSTICRTGGDSLYRSFDDGKNWEEFLHGLSIGHMNFRTSYMKPEYNGGENLIHWLSDFKINPFNENEAWFNTGTGVFRTQNLMDREVIFSDWSDGIEETVHLNCYALPKGDVKLLDIVGDLGGFAFENLDSECRNSFDDADGNRYITCNNADYSDDAPEHIVITARGNWTGRTAGGLIRTDDACKTYRHIDLPYGITDRLDDAMKHIATPNVNAGFTAVSDSCNNIIWSVAKGIRLPADMVIVSHDGGKSFKQVKIEDPAEGFKAFSDRVDARIFYGFDEKGRIYLSDDYGDSFRLREEALPEIDFTLIDSADKTCVKFAAGEKGVAYICEADHGLFRFVYSDEQDKISITKLNVDSDIIYRIGLGVNRPGGIYTEPHKAIYAAARIDGTYGFFRTLDEGKTFVLLSDEHQHYGAVNCMDGDCVEFGRFYFGTGGRGLFHAEPATKAQ